MQNFVYRFLLISFIAMNVVILKSAFIEDMPQSVSQPDGTVLNCFARGDEFFNWLHDSNGYTIMQNPTTGWYVYADLVNDEFIPTTLIPGKSNPALAGLKPWLIYSEAKLRSFRDKFKIPDTYSKVQKNPEQLQSSENRGLLNNLAIFIRFSDDAGFSQSATYFDTPYNSPNAISVYNYYYEVSYNQLEIKTNFFPQPNGQTVVSYQDNMPRSYYKKYNAVTAPNGYKNDNERTIREMTLLKNTVETVSQNIPADLDFDMNNDGLVDNVAFIVTGGPEGWADLIWPHMWALYLYDVQINGLRVWNFNFLMANWFDSSVLCHEMFHTLGAPDLYRYYVGGTPVGIWDIMSNNAYPPQYTSMFMRWKYGNWIDEIPKVTKSGWYELNPSSMKEGSVLKVQSRYNFNEYFVLEYRKKEGRYDVSIPKSGLVVWRINTLYDGNAGGPPDGVYIYRQNGTPSSWGSINDAPFAEDYGKVKFNDYSTNPKPFLTNGSNGGLNISNVGRIENTIKFRINFPPLAPILVNPLNNEAASPKNPVFIWDAAEDADYYSFELAKDANFTNIIYTKNNILETSLELPFELDYLSSYYWRVKSFSNYEEQSAWSNANFFVVTPEKPVISSNTKSQLICKNEDFLLFVSAVGSVMQYQWYKDDKPIAGADSPVMTKDKAGYWESAVYTCRITNFPGKDTVMTEDIGIYVVTQTNFITMPQTQFSSIGGSINFTFRIHVNGKEDKNYTDIKWYKDGSIILDSPRINGAKTDMLNINYLQEDDFGAKYIVEVTGRCGIVLSANMFTINKFDESVVRSYDTTLCGNIENLLSADIESNIPDGYTLKAKVVGDIGCGINMIDGKYFVKTDIRQASADTHSVSVEYYLEPSDYLIEKVTYNIRFTEAPYLMIDLPKERKLQEGDIFQIAPETNPVPSKAEWYHNGEQVYKDVNLGKLTIDYATLDLAGEWKIRFFNECGEVWTTTCNFIIYPKGEHPTGIDDELNKNGIAVYPNPADNQINVLFDTESNYQTLDITDILGNIVARHTIPSGSRSIMIDLSNYNLTTGTYFVILKNDNGIKSVKFSLVK